MFHNILVCVDGSEHAERALGEAIDLATTQRSRLTLLTAVSRPPYWANTPLTAAGIEPLAVDLQKEAEKTLRAAVDQVPDSVPVTKLLTEDPIREALICQIKTGKYDLVVMGSRGHGDIVNLVLGSVATKVLAKCSVPVLLIR